MPRPVVAFVLAVLAAGVAGCGGDDRPPQERPSARRSAAPASAALCSGLRAQVTGRVADPAATELSGLVRSRTQDGVLWALNDSGNAPNLFAVRANGTVPAVVPVAGAENVDWEDIAARGRTLYLADIGDNSARRDAIAVYRVREPDLSAEPSAQARRIDLRYPGGGRDAEALLVDPVDGRLVIVTKSLVGQSGVYEAGPQGGTLRPAGELDLGLAQAVTAGDISADGRTIVLRTYDRVYVWTRRPGESVTAALRRPWCSPRPGLAQERQGETLALSADGRAFTTVPEGAGAALRRYAPG